MHDRRHPLRPRRPLGPWTEDLEPRKLLVAPPINVATGLAFALALPVPGLATGIGLPSSASTLPTVSVSVSPSPTPSPAPSAMSFGPTATGPSTTLSPLANDSETAVAAASEVARPTPGRSDRISSFVESPPIVPLPHLAEPEPVEVIPDPVVPARPPVPVAPAPPLPADRVAPEPPAATPAAPEVPPTGPTALAAWDAAIDLLGTDSDEGQPDEPVPHAGGLMASGALLAAWGGWKYGPRREGHSKRRGPTISLDKAGPGH